MKWEYWRPGYDDLLAASRSLVPQLVAMLREAVAALEYIKSKEHFADKPKWGNEFVDVSKQSIARIEQLAGGGGA